jgi:hypothetical protein
MNRMIAHAPNDITAEHSGQSLPTKLAAIAEVLLAFAVVHVSFRAIKQFTAWGRFEGEARLNFTPGIVMILFTFAALALFRRTFAAYGMTFAHWRENLKLECLLGWCLLLARDCSPSLACAMNPAAASPR